MWMAEHHFQPEGYECIPNLIMLNVHLAHLTKNIKFGCGFNIAPMWHPLRLAEDYATADILTNGRVIFGVGRGYHTREVETFGSNITDQDANREEFEEAVDIIFKAFNNESFSHKGKYYTLPPEVPYRGYTLKDLTLVPRPKTLPVECWQPIQGGTERALDFMAKHGIKGILGGGVAEGGVMDSIMTGYRDALVRAGNKDAQLGEGLSVGFHYHLAPTVEQGIKEAKGFFEENLKMFGPLRLHRGLTDEQIEIDTQVEGSDEDAGFDFVDHASDGVWHHLIRNCQHRLCRRRERRQVVASTILRASFGRQSWLCLLCGSCRP